MKSVSQQPDSASLRPLCQKQRMNLETQVYVYTQLHPQGEQQEVQGVFVFITRRSRRRYRMHFFRSTGRTGGGAGYVCFNHQREQEVHGAFISITSRGNSRRCRVCLLHSPGGAEAGAGCIYFNHQQGEQKEEQAAFAIYLQVVEHH